MKASLLFALLLSGCVPSFAADAPLPANRFAASLVPAERFDAGTLLVERHGQHGTPLILIPGLGGGTWVWQDTVRAFQKDHVVYVVTLPGFDGRAPVPGNGIDAARQSLQDLITARKLAKPVLIGHSLGAAMSIAFAERRSDLIGGVIAIDGLPVFPGTENMPTEQRPQMAEGVKAGMAGATHAMFVAQQQQYMRGIGVIDMAKADELAKLNAKSDQAAMAQYMGELFALDLRPGLPDIKVPVLVISPYFETDGALTGHSEAMKTDYYRSLMAGTPKVEVISVSPARHFVMFDQPQRVAEAIRNYLNAL